MFPPPEYYLQQHRDRIREAHERAQHTAPRRPTARPPHRIRAGAATRLRRIADLLDVTGL